ncbi:MAG: arginine--tRNA ligase [Planctomycetota bacterium]|nr:arginine--tRNA ligase [Planctomycetota bacterium]
MPHDVPRNDVIADPLTMLSQRVKSAIAAAFPEAGTDADPLITPSKHAALGDYQCNAAMGLAKRLGKPPRDVAQAIVDKLDLSGLAEPLNAQSIAGPGFINIKLAADALTRMLAGMDSPELGVPKTGGERIVVDLCGVNLAKQMHVGHLRSTIIGDALARILERMGNDVIRQNHLGDWGLPIAMVTAKIAEDAAAGRVDLSKLTIDTLERAYRQAKRDAEADEAGLAAVRKFGLGPKAAAELEEQVFGAREQLSRAKSTLIKLQNHDPATLAVWQRIVDVTIADCVHTCARLRADVKAEYTAGESSYATELAGIVEDLLARGVAEMSEGAVVVRVEGISEPCLIRKSDGGFLYATTDFAGIRRRVQKIGASRVVYCVDARQALHFKQAFAGATKAGYAAVLDAAGKPTGRNATLEHAAFGMVLGDDGRPFKTRSGDNVKLVELVDEGRDRALAQLKMRSPDASDADLIPAAEALSVAAIKYADLSNDRAKDYVFRFDRMIAFEGNTGPYLLYAYARIRSIFRKAVERGVGDSWKNAPLRVSEPAEKALALALLRYPSAMRSVNDSLEPHRLCQFLYDLAGAFSSFFDACPVLQADDATRDARLRLCDLTSRVLRDGLTCLGIPVLERM